MLQYLSETFNTLSKPIKFDASKFVIDKAPQKPEFVFHPPKFKSSNNDELVSQKTMLGYDFNTYAKKHRGFKPYTFKNAGIIDNPLFAVPLFIMGIGLNFEFIYDDIFGIYEYSEALIISALFLPISLKGLYNLWNVSKGDDRKYATKKGYEKFLKEKETKVKELELLVNQEREEHKRNCLKAEERARIEHEKLLAKYEKLVKDHALHVEKTLKKKEAAEAQHVRDEKIREDWILKLKNGDLNILAQACELILPIQFVLDEQFIETDPSEFDYGFEVVSKEHIRILIQLPESLQFIPEYEVKLKPSGRESTQKLNSDRAQKEATIYSISSLTVFIFTVLFESFESLRTIDVELHQISIDPTTGNPILDPIITVNMLKDDYMQLNLKNIDPVLTIQKYARGFKNPGDKGKINSSINIDEIIWSDSDDTSQEIDTYVKDIYSSIFNEKLNKNYHKKSFNFKLP